MDKKILAIIPARGGSKSIPGKNIKMLGNKPLIAYPIQLAKSVSRIDGIVVSTDSEEIGNVAKKWGAEVPFIRPDDLAKDDTPVLPVLRHCVRYLEDIEDYRVDIIVLLFTTNPFLTKRRVEEALDMMIKNRYSSVISVKETWGRFWKYDETTRKYNILYPEKRVNRQYYKPLYEENGAIYFSDYETLMNKNKIVDELRTGFITMKREEVIDIDTPQDWSEAEKKLQGFSNGSEH